LALAVYTARRWQVIDEACDGLEAVGKTIELDPDIVLLDVGMPDLNGIEAAERIHKVSRNTEITFLTQQDDADIKIAALATGAVAFLLKANATSELLPTVEAALQSGHDARTLSFD
jgi:DNA-binding NarL/FixJ family response regulator